jgi:hypothetical protein
MSPSNARVGANPESRELLPSGKYVLWSESSLARGELPAALGRRARAD